MRRDIVLCGEWKFFDLSCRSDASLWLSARRSLSMCLVGSRRSE